MANETGFHHAGLLPLKNSTAMELHPMYNLPQLMMRYRDGSVSLVYNHEVKEGDVIVENYIKNPDGGMPIEQKIRIDELIEIGPSAGDFSKWERAPFHIRAKISRALVPTEKPA